VFCSDAGKLDLMFVYDDVYVFVFCFSKVELYFFRKSDVMLLIVQASIVALIHTARSDQEQQEKGGVRDMIGDPL
jgi:hypothetical protein